MDLGLADKNVLITGGSRGIGRSIADTFAAAGANVAFCARSEDGVAATIDALTKMGVKTYGEAIDVRNEVAFHRWIDNGAKALGGIDIIVSNVSTRDDLGSDTLWQDTFNADFLQHVRFFERALPYMKKRDESAAVFIASIASILTQLPPQELAYGTMKAALVNYVGQMAVQNAKQGVRVNAVSPGPIEFEGGFWDGVKKAAPDAYARASNLPAMGRLGRPEEVAKSVVFLASPASGYTTGANLRIDGAAVKAANF